MLSTCDFDLTKGSTKSSPPRVDMLTLRSISKTRLSRPAVLRSRSSRNGISKVKSRVRCVTTVESFSSVQSVGNAGLRNTHDCFRSWIFGWVAPTSLWMSGLQSNRRDDWNVGIPIEWAG